MIKFKYFNLSILILNLVFTGCVLANQNGVIVTGKKIIALPSIPHKNSDNLSARTSIQQDQPKNISVQSIRLTPNFKQELKKRFKELQTIRGKGLNKLEFTTSISNHYLQPDNFTMDLGMANVPVLDQGVHGTCTVFATTAAIEAIKFAGDYISQQCLLELGTYQELESNNMINSGWDGAEFNDILNRINNYGIVDKQTCPHKYGYKGYSMTPMQYFDYSFNGQWAKAFNWKTLSIIPSNSLEQIKVAINNNHRVLIGTFIIFDYSLGLPYQNLSHGLYDLPEGYGLSSFIKDLNQDKINQHSLIVIGYDEATQIFKLRNSLGNSYGNNGNFYMSYDYLSTMLTEAIEIY